MCHCSPAASATVNGCARSWYLSQYADARPAVCRRLLCSPASAAQHSSICSVVCVSVAVCCLVLSRLDYGNATLAGLLSCLLNRLHSLSSTRQLGRSPVFVDRNILQMFSPVFTGCECEHLSASSPNLSTCRTVADLPTRVEAGCARRPPVHSTSARRGLSLSAIALLLLLAHDSGTVYVPTSSLPHHSQHFVRN